MAWRDWQTLDKTIANTVMGVTMGNYVDVSKAIIKSSKNLLKDNDTTLAYDLFKIADGYNPASTLWATRGLWENYAASKIRKTLSADKERRRARWKKNQMRKEKTSKIF